MHSIHEARREPTFKSCPPDYIASKLTWNRVVEQLKAKLDAEQKVQCSKVIINTTDAPSLMLPALVLATWSG